MTPTERFFAKVNKTETCWLWTASRQKGRPNPYGYFQFYKLMTAHRASWIIHFGPIPDGMQVLHHCDVGLCVHPDHLFLGDHNANMRDKRAKRRESRGENHGLAKLTEEDVRLIRSLYKADRHYTGACSLARRFGVDRMTILCIATRRTWTHI